MAIGTGISFTLSDALQEADKLDNHFNKWVQQSIEINANMRKAFTSKSTGEVATGLRDLKGLIDGIAGKTISPKTNAEDVQKLGDALDRVAKAVDLLANENVELFDTKGLYDTEKSLAETSAELSTVLDKISKLKNLWKEVSSWDIDKSAENLRASSGYQLTPEDAIAAAKQAQEIKKQEIEDELRIEIEKKAIAQKELQWAKKTQDEKAQYIQKKLDEIFKAEEQQANKIRAEYKRLNQELRNTVTSRGAIEDAVGGKVEEASKSGRITSKEKEAYDALVNYESELRQQILQMEIEHLEHISELRISYAAKDAKNIADEIKKRQYSASEALAMASSARTGEDMERAKEAVKNALMTVDKDDLDTIDELNKAYLNLRASIEKLTKAQKNEQTLQPTIRNEYARVLKEIDAVVEAKHKLRSTKEFKDGDPSATKAMEDLEKRHKDLSDRAIQLKEQAESLLDEVERKHASDRARERVAEFEKNQKELEERIKKYGTIDVDEAKDIISETADVKNVRQAEEAIERLKEARDRLNKSDSEYQETIDELNEKIAEQQEYIESIIDAEAQRERQQQEARETYQGAMDYSQQARSIRDINNAIRALDAARRREDLSTREGRRNYRSLTRELERQQRQYNRLTNDVNNASRGLINTAEQLKRAFGLLFSVSQIKGYIHQIIEVRGEFEMQHRSMQVLIGDIDKANELWDKTISLATKSPFRVKELVTYTKQLAAYRVEADKLYETNKMLADISSGLGVDMNRLILAFGQVKAANYLRGTELRQFSEAGINILELLAKRFEEVQGRAISTGEVFEMVSKRLVSFEDVNAVLQQVTSEGGMFYQMQEKQSETLQGMIRNLRDSIDLMMNDMGISMNDELKNAVTLVKTLVDEWRKLVPIVAAIGTAMLFSVARKGILSLVGGIDKMIRGFNRLRAVSSAAAAVNPWLLLATVIASVTAAVIAARKEVNRLTAAMGQVESNNKKQLTESISLYRKLAETANDATKTELERDKAMKNLEERFKSILPDSMLEADYVKQLGNNYEEANRAMMAYYDAKTREQKKDKVDAMFDADIYEKRFPKLISGLKHITETTTVLSKEQKLLIDSYAGNIFGDLINDAKNGEVAIESLFDEFKKRLSEYTEISSLEIDEMFRHGGTKWVEDRLEKLGETLEEYNSTLLGITGLSYATRSEEVAMEWKNAEKENLEAIMAEYKKFANYYHQFATANEKDRKKIADSVTLSLSQVPESLASYKPHLEKAVNDLKEAAEGGAWSFASSMQKIEQSFVKGLKYIVSRSVNAQEYDAYSHAGKFLVNFATNMNEGIDKAAEDLDLSKFQEGIIDGIGKVVEKTKVSVDEFAKYLPKMGESLSDVKNRVSGDIEVLKKRVEDYTTSISTGLDKTSIISEKILKENPQQIEYFQKSLIPALQLFLQLLGDTEKHKGGGGSSLMDERIKVVDDMNRAYTELNKTLSENEALEGAFAKYKDAFQKAYAGTALLPKNFGSMTAEQFLKEFNFTTEEGMVSFFDKLIAYAKKTGEQVDVELAKGEYIMEARVELKKDEDKKLLDSIQELFDQYDLSLELKELNIPKDLAESLFDVDYLDLDGLKKAVQEQEAKFIGTDMEKDYEEFLKKISDLSRKQREDEAKEFVNFLKKNLNEIQLIQDKGAYNISLADKLFGQGKITAEQYMSSIRQIVEDTNKEVAKVNLDKFKDSATYIKAMGNLAAYSRDELEGMISVLQGQVGANAGNMGADEIRTYYEALERLVDQYDKLESPFQKGEINDLIEYLNLQKELNKEKEKEAALEQKKLEINNRLNLLQAQLKSQQERGDVLGAASTQRQIKSAVSELKEVDGELVSVTSNISVISEKVANLGDGMVKGLVVAQKVVNEIANIANASTKMFDDIKSAADALGADTESGGWAKAGYAMEMVGGVSSELTSGLSNLASGNFAGALANVVGMVTKLISGFAKIHDQNYQDIIEAQAEAVERLGKAYEKLETATESAYSIQQLQQYNEELERNIELQIASYKAMIAAEHAKKNTDEEQIEAWNEELEALTEQWEELKASLLEGVGGVSKDNYRSQTREFVDAWVSAFKETGNGLQGLKDNFREFFDNIIAEQAAMQVTEKYLEPFYASLNEALNDYELTAKESKDLRELVETIAPDLSSALEKIWSQLGGSLGEADGAGLSSLQKGISGMSEEQAEILIAYWNSVRGYTASIDSKMDLILANMGMGTENNPMLEQLISQTSWLSKIHGILEDVASASPRAFKTALM